MSENKRLFKIVEIEINSRCNMACSYCPNSVDERVEQGDMEDKTFEKILDSLEASDFRGIVSFHFYNEPLLSKKLAPFAKLLKQRLPKVLLQIYSNGTLLTKKKFDELREAGVDAFNITKHEDVKPNYIFDKTYEELNEEERKRVIYNNYTQIDMSNRSGILEDIQNGAGEKTPCLLPSIMMSITLKGNILPCYEDFYQKLVMGNIHQNTLEEIWFGEKFSNFRQELRKPGGRLKNSPCDKCNCFNLPVFRYND
ncbi:radical SAM/SPASM domain-containing protein [Bacteriovorax sp. DB6_IX]|uniref:radical SAM/SPASM domain-containing protein n=1 Tax=Bacteriovorax sp. DB6_IX TaxID=1353530 RepID=UPI00038A2920|nr:radical SAM/SPASM domain-containing protein [Bacteriovorax sp. DB6_IX]EQC50898.1 putative butirosin biosynthesis radical SAM-dependent enzyme BtrN [Bacteriovorax sp. DB6_IX]